MSFTTFKGNIETNVATFNSTTLSKLTKEYVKCYDHGCCNLSQQYIRCSKLIYGNTVSYECASVARILIVLCKATSYIFFLIL